jgi:hypothetical protein
MFEYSTHTQAQDRDISVQVVVQGRPTRISQHASLATSEERGNYLSTVFISIKGARVAVPVFSKDVADITAAALFRQHNLPFDEQYIDGKPRSLICVNLRP